MFHQSSTGAASGGVRPCDSCVKPSTTWAYPCQPFARGVTDGVRVIPAGPWRACTTCHKLIDADRWAELRWRSPDLYRASCGPLTHTEDTAIAADLAPLWLTFRENRTGPAERITGGAV